MIDDSELEEDEEDEPDVPDGALLTSGMQCLVCWHPLELGFA